MKATDKNSQQFISTLLLGYRIISDCAVSACCYQTQVICYIFGNSCFFLTLVEGEACWWTIHPASKQRSEGEKVRVGDDLILVSVSSERYLVRLLLVLHNDGNIYTVCLF